MSDVSVLTLVKNRAVHLQRLVEGLRRSTTPPRELIVVDMSEPPVALDPVPEFPVTVVRLETPGLPLAQARNLAARHAGGSHLLFLDVDCIPMAGLVASIDAALSAADDLICAEVLYLPAEAVGEDWTEAGLTSVAAPHPVRAFPPEGSRIEPNAGLFWSLTFGTRRRTFDDVGGFDEAFTGYGAEDTDFGFRCRDAGLPLVFRSGPGSFHQHHAVHHPPLQHFDAIVANATRFHTRWKIWPMEGWLKSFAERGLLRVGPDRLTVLRQPMPSEIEAARQPREVRF
ncbi:glycosyl transferase [Brevundimonas sp. LM2]|uniref:glycosyltransferase family 2 protein n=1 Tax=Brevundimonas sp. LM2 TaxID=1938605 RepID=UPI000983BAC0|nr:glycosyltransferase [Brevundimonas sp. LM2]AQR63572.1 glycosyl transferase [Brevundimonas sp. LM2]